MNIPVLVDASGSMSVLGKEEISKSMIQTLSLLNKLYPKFNDIEFDFKNWNLSEDTLEKLNNTSAKTVLLTDGFDISPIDNRNVVVILIGEDCASCSNHNYFKAVDILNAIDYLLGF